MNVGDVITKDQARDLPVGAKFTDRDGTRGRTIVDVGYYTRDTDGGYRREFAALPNRQFVITNLPGTEKFTIGQRVDQDVVRRLPTGAVWNGEDGRPRTVVEQGRTYRDPGGVKQRLEAWRGRNGRLVSLPDQPNVPNVGDLIQPARLRDLPEGSEVRVPGNGNRYFKRGGDMVSSGGGRVVNIANFGVAAEVTSLPEQPKETVAYRHKVGDSRIDGSDLRDLPEGAVIRGDNDRMERHIVDNDEWVYVERADQRRYPVATLGGPYTLVSLPDAKPAAHGYTVGQVVTRDDAPNLPIGTVLLSVDGDAQRRTIISATEYRLANGGGTWTFRALGEHRRYTIVELPGQPAAAPALPKVGDVIQAGDVEGLRSLPDGSEVELVAVGHRYVKAGDQMEPVGQGRRTFTIEQFGSTVTITWMPGMKRDTAWAVGQQVNAAQLGNLPVGTTFRAVDGHTDYLTVEGGNDRRGLGGAVTHYVQPDQGIVNGGGLLELARLAGDFTIVGLPDDAVETLAEFKARVWRVLTPYRESDYTGAHTKRLLRELGITAPEPVVPEDPALVEEFKAQMWQHVAGAARDQGWCATWKKPLAELGISEPKPKTVTTTITISHDPTKADVEHLRGHVGGLAGVESVEVSR